MLTIQKHPIINGSKCLIPECKILGVSVEQEPTSGPGVEKIYYIEALVDTGAVYEEREFHIFYEGEEIIIPEDKDKEYWGKAGDGYVFELV